MLVLDHVDIGCRGEYDAVGCACYGLASGRKCGGGFDWVIEEEGRLRGREGSFVEEERGEGVHCIDEEIHRSFYAFAAPELRDGRYIFIH
jgi:hypothetical protein